jgi:hypothetical protein
MPKTRSVCEAQRFRLTPPNRSSRAAEGEMAKLPSSQSLPPQTRHRTSAWSRFGLARRSAAWSNCCSSHGGVRRSPPPHSVLNRHPLSADLLTSLMADSWPRLASYSFCWRVPPILLRGPSSVRFRLAFVCAPLARYPLVSGERATVLPHLLRVSLHPFFHFGLWSAPCVRRFSCHVVAGGRVHPF